MPYFLAPLTKPKGAVEDQPWTTLALDHELIPLWGKPSEVPKGYTLVYRPSTDEQWWINLKIQQELSRTKDHVPWITQEWARSSLDGAIKAKEGVSYYPTPQHAIEGRRVETTVARYLLGLWETQAKRSTAWIKSHGPMDEARIEYWIRGITDITMDNVTITDDPEEIEWVYVNGPSSCMSYSKDHFPDCRGLHPSATYGKSPDLRMAYLKNQERRDKITQRVMIWPEQKTYGRIYGTGPLADLFNKQAYKDGKFQGARMRLVQVPGYKDRYLIPYIDRHASVNLDGDYLVLREGTDGEIRCNGTSGIFVIKHCQRCGERSGGDHCATCKSKQFTCQACKGVYWTEDHDSLKDKNKLKGQFWIRSVYAMDPTAPQEVRDDLRGYPIYTICGPDSDCFKKYTTHKEWVRVTREGAKYDQ